MKGFSFAQIGGTLGKDPESRSTPNGTKAWGFWYHDAIKGDVFVPYGTSKEGVEEGIKRHKEGTRGWSTCPLSKATTVSETIQ